MLPIQDRMLPVARSPPATMSTQLRSRASRPNYAALSQYEDEGAGPSKHPHPEEVNSDSDFAPQEAQDEAIEEGESMDEDAEAEEDVPTQEPSRENSIAIFTKPAAPRTKDSKAKPKNPNTNNHRQRALPLFDRLGPVERLIERPSPFGTPRITSTQSLSVNRTVLERTGKAWGYNVGQGGLWDLLEDRMWFKESMASSGEELADEKARRPRVHEGVRASGFEVIELQCVPFMLSGTCTMSHFPREGQHLCTSRRTFPSRSKGHSSPRLLLPAHSDRMANRRVFR